MIRVPSWKAEEVNRMIACCWVRVSIESLAPGFFTASASLFEQVPKCLGFDLAQVQGCYLSIVTA